MHFLRLLEKNGDKVSFQVFADEIEAYRMLAHRVRKINKDLDRVKFVDFHSFRSDNGEIELDLAYTNKDEISNYKGAIAF